MNCPNCGRFIGTTHPAWVIYRTEGDAEYCSLGCLRQHDPAAAAGFEDAVRTGDAFYRPAARRRLEVTVIL